MTPAKGVEIILSSVDRICDAHECTFHFVGDEITPGYLDHFRRLVASLRHPRAVRVHGHQTRAAAHKLIRECQLFLFPSMWNGEGQPAALIEAMAIGLVPIGTRWRGIGEIIQNGHNGMLLDAPEAGQLADHVMRVMDDPDLCEQLSRNARHTILSQYEATVALDQFRQILRDVL